MKKIGLVGGMTPESTTAYYQMLIELGRRRWDDPVHNPIILIYSIDLAEIVAHQDVGDGDRVVEILAGALESLRAAGAEVGALTANTPHIFFDRIRAATTLPLISIVDTALERVRDLGAGRALLLGTKATMEGPMYPNAFAGCGIEIVIPTVDDREFINQSIYVDLAAGKVTPDLRRRYQEICHHQVEDNGVEAVILGCTEIPMVLSTEDCSVPLIDTARCHAEALFAHAVGVD